MSAFYAQAPRPLLQSFNTFYQKLIFSFFFFTYVFLEFRRRPRA